MEKTPSSATVDRLPAVEQLYLFIGGNNGSLVVSSRCLSDAGLARRNLLYADIH